VFVFVYLSKCGFSFSTICQNVSNGARFLDDLDVLSPILCDTVTIIVYTDQFTCHCVFIQYVSTENWLLFLHDGFSQCLC